MRGIPPLQVLKITTVTTKKIRKRNTKNLIRKKNNGKNQKNQKNQKNHQATINTINLTKAAAVAKINRLQKCPAMGAVKVLVIMATFLKSQRTSIPITSHLQWGNVIPTSKHRFQMTKTRHKKFTYFDFTNFFQTDFGRLFPVITWAVCLKYVKLLQA